MFHRLTFSATSNSPSVPQPYWGGAAFYAIIIACLLALAAAGLVAL
ncbi:MAG: hypothetical protein JO339_25665 [Alphaproteobacteria bacterium]|nr:hypothetical protein [Alphaproteobacteria bacterium]